MGGLNVGYELNDSIAILNAEVWEMALGGWVDLLPSVSLSCFQQSFDQNPNFCGNCD